MTKLKSGGDLMSQHFACPPPGPHARQIVHPARQRVVRHCHYVDYVHLYPHHTKHVHEVVHRHYHQPTYTESCETVHRTIHCNPPRPRLF